MTWVRRNLWVLTWLLILAGLWIWLGRGWAMPKDAAAFRLAAQAAVPAVASLR